MRIISSFHDYYDTVQSSFPKEDVTFIRETEHAETSQSFLYYDRTFSFLWFCGQWYILYHVFTVDKETQKVNAVHNFSSLDSAEAFIKSLGKKEWTFYTCNTYKKWSLKTNCLSRYTVETVSQRQYKELIKNKQQYINELDILRKQYDEPIIRFKYYDYHQLQICINPRLQPLEFVSVVDPYTAYCQVRQFISNRALPEKYVPIMDNKTKIEQHGFDVKNSFRKKK